MNPSLILKDPETGDVLVSGHSRDELHVHQRTLEAKHGGYLYCGCGQVVVVARSQAGFFYTKALPGQRDLHRGCLAIGEDIDEYLGPAQDVQSGVHCCCARMIDLAYAEQFDDPAPDSWFFVAGLKLKLIDELKASGHPALVVEVGLVENEDSSSTERPTALTSKVATTDAEGRQIWENKVLTLNTGICVRCRTDPRGFTLPGLHLTIAIADGNMLTHLNISPVEMRSGRIHPIHSRFEAKVFAELERTGMRVLKIPSEKFLLTWRGVGRVLMERLASERIWPDFIVFDAQDTPTLVEAAGLTNTKYLLRILDKLQVFRRWEDEFGLQWMVVDLADHRSRIVHRSMRLDIADAFNEGGAC